MDEYYNFLISHVKPFCKPASGGRWVNCRCFYCPDSKNMSHGHMYISIPQSEGDVSIYYCQKCKTVGLVTPKKLIEWNIYDYNIASYLSKINKTASPRSHKYMGLDKYDTVNDTISRNDRTQYKLDYINKRLGTNLSLTDCLKLKIVLNLSDLFKRNYLVPTRDSRIMESLDKGFLGFLSVDNAFLNMRNVGLIENLHPSINMRYVNYNIYGKYDNSHRFYTIPANIDIADNSPVRLHVSEGPFDALSIYLNLKRNSDRDICTSVGGSGYKGVIRYFITLLSLPNIEIHVYPDNDQSRYSILDIAEYIRPFKYPFYIHRNVYPGEKDFGVDINKIKEVVEKVDV